MSSSNLIENVQKLNQQKCKEITVLISWLGLPTPWKINKGHIHTHKHTYTHTHTHPDGLVTFFGLFCVWNDFQIISLECEFSLMHVFEWYKYIEKNIIQQLIFLCKIRYI